MNWLERFFAWWEFYWFFIRYHFSQQDYYWGLRSMGSWMLLMAGLIFVELPRDLVEVTINLIKWIWG